MTGNRNTGCFEETGGDQISDAWRTSIAWMVQSSIHEESRDGGMCDPSLAESFQQTMVYSKQLLGIFSSLWQWQWHHSSQQCTNKIIKGLESIFCTNLAVCNHHAWLTITVHNCSLYTCKSNLLLDFLYWKTNCQTRGALAQYLLSRHAVSSVQACSIVFCWSSFTYRLLSGEHLM